MKTASFSTIGALAAAPFLAAAPSYADDGPISAEFSAGVEYDDHLSVSEIDRTSNDEDFAAILDAGIGLEHETNGGTAFSAGYDFFQSVHFDRSDFDIRSHRGSVGLAQDFGEFDLGVDYNYVYSTLDDVGFLTYQLLSPYVASSLTKQLYVRAAYSYADKDFKSRPTRDATVNAGGADVFFFLNGTTTYLLFGYKFEHEDAVGPEFDFDAHNLKARLTQKFPFNGRKGALKIGWRYENRDYDSITPSIGAVRDDERNRFQAEIELPLSDHVYAQAEYEYSDFDSNLPAVNYTQNLISARLGVKY
ncbi:MAG: hypothetical protein ACE5FO_07885 [Parvularculaceae bacterium]